MENSAAGPSPDMRALLDQLARENAGTPDPTTVSPEEGRAIAAQRNQRWQVDPPSMADVRTMTIAADPGLRTAARPAIVFTPPRAKPGAIVFVHGGGFALCSTETHDRCMRVLAVESGRSVVGIDYRLAPEEPFPAGLHDVIAAWRTVSNRCGSFGLDDGPLLISGDSAGANLAMAAILHEHDAGRVLPDAALLFYGTYDADFDTESYRDYAEDFGLTTGQMRRYWDWYAPDPDDRRNPLAAPFLASDGQMKAMPPLFLLAAEIDPLASDTYRLKARLDRLGRADEMHVEPGVVHGFLQMTPKLAAARNAMAVAGAAVDRLIERDNRNGRIS
ncbi:MAG: alpha/beta hydrolase [Hyphomicrobiales bacterium]|nr:alpha/beta hydrolase [Hyphomicrobiales bacterium]